jgi:hypothetical protein
MLIEWAAIATATVVVVLLVDRATRFADGRRMDERPGTDIGPPGPVSVGPVVMAPRERRAGGRRRPELNEADRHQR